MSEVETRVCRECGAERPLTSEFFPVCARGLRGVCKICWGESSRKKRKEHYEKNKVETLAKKKDYDEKNKEKIAAYQAEYRAKKKHASKA